MLLSGGNFCGNYSWIHLFCNVSQSNQLLPPATKLGQGNIFTGVCDSVNRGGSASVHAGIPQPPCSGTMHPWDHAPPPQDHAPLPPGTMHPPGPCTPSRRRACREIRSTRGRYASYWNAILFSIDVCACNTCVSFSF